MNEKKSFPVFVPIMAAILIIIGCVSYIAMKFMQFEAYERKWKDYDDCGI